MRCSQRVPTTPPTTSSSTARTMLRSFSAGLGGTKRRASNILSSGSSSMRKRPFGVVPNEFVVSARVQVQRIVPVWLTKARWLVLRGSKTPTLAVYRQVTTGAVLDDLPLRVMLLGSDTVVQVAGNKNIVLSTATRVGRSCDTWVVAFESSAQRWYMYELVKTWIELGVFLHNLTGFDCLVKSNNSVVYRCYERNADDKRPGVAPVRRQFALKRMSKAKCSDEVAVTERALAIEGLQPYLARYLYMYETSEDESVTIVMQFYNGGSLADRIRASGSVPEKVAKSVVSSLCCALYALHQHGILHLDVKAANILFDSDSPRVFTNLKLVDFGGSVLVRPQSCGSDSTAADEKVEDEDEEKHRQQKAISTYGCMAPERFDGRYGPEADVYGAGVVLYHMIVGDVPFPGSDPYQVMVKNMHGNVSFASPMWRRVSKSLRRLAERMLDKDPVTRITIPEILKTRWLFQNLSDHDIGLHTTPPKDASGGATRQVPPSPGSGVRNRGVSDCNFGSDYFSAQYA